jgi:hypothetical protein
MIGPYTAEIPLDLGILGEHDAVVVYDADAGEPASRWEPGTPAFFVLESVKVKGVDVLPIIAEKKAWLDDLTAYVKGHLA